MYGKSYFNSEASLFFSRTPYKHFFGFVFRNRKHVPLLVVFLVGNKGFSWVEIWFGMMVMCW